MMTWHELCKRKEGFNMSGIHITVLLARLG